MHLNPLINRRLVATHTLAHTHTHASGANEWLRHAGSAGCGEEQDGLCESRLLDLLQQETSRGVVLTNDGYFNRKSNRKLAHTHPQTDSQFVAQMKNTRQTIRLDPRPSGGAAASVRLGFSQHLSHRIHLQPSHRKKKKKKPTFNAPHKRT